MGVVDFAGVGGPSALAKIVRKFSKANLKVLTVQQGQILQH